ncbi:hypothetical protein LTSEHVI_1924, partial [Salmonella enterica subsp. enterica serovar Hvittingfoss str. A4-620]
MSTVKLTRQFNWLINPQSEELMFGFLAVVAFGSA